MPKPVRPPIALLVVAVLVAAVSLTTDVSANAATAATWKTGDCFADANVDLDEVTLSSAVPCTKEHAVQVVGGADLPAALAAAPLTTLVDTKSSVRAQLVDFAAETCSATEVVKNIYTAKQAKALATLFEDNDIGILDWVFGAAGRMGWVLPDQASYDAGTKAMLCVFQPDATLTGSSAGDIREVATSDPLETLRLCFDFNAENTGSAFQPCDEVHDGESLIWLSLPVTGKPSDVSTWSDADYAPLDDVCARFAAVLIGAKRTDLLYRADTDPNQAPIDGNRYFNCRTYPKKKTAAFPAGLVVTGLGKAKISFAKT